MDCHTCKGVLTREEQAFRSLRALMRVNLQPVSDAKSKLVSTFITVIQHDRSAGFPHRDLKQLDARYRVKYNVIVAENLGNIRDFGIRRFLNNEDERWTCVECGGAIYVHQGRCSKCGASQPNWNGSWYELVSRKPDLVKKS